MRHLPKLSLLFTALVVTSLFFGFFKSSVHAQSTVCSASTNPTSIAANTEVNLEVTVNNSSPTVEGVSTSVLGLYDAMIVWIKITAPSGTTIVQDVSDGDWAGATEDSSVTLEGGTISSGSSASFVLTVQTGANLVYSDQWTVEASIEPGGGGTIATCGIGAVSRLPVISGISVNISSTGASISWTTDVVADSTVEYGTTTSYGSSAYDATSTKSHGVILAGLSSSTVYYYRVKSTGAGGTGEVGGNSFTTAAALTAATATTTTTTSRTPSTTTATRGDTILPTALITTQFSDPFEESPVVEGRASDNTAVSKVDYSIDGGVNWLPVDNTSGLGGKSVSFDFSPLGVSEDGNYKIMVRATDSSGNRGVSRVYTLVIDRLPPLVGASLFSLGPLVLSPDANGFITTLEGIKQKIILSAAGGPTSIDLLVNGKMHSLPRSFETGLWAGGIIFAEPGVYEILAKSVDGAGNKTERKLNSVIVVESGKVINKNTQEAIKGAKIRLYQKDLFSQTWLAWDSSSFNQENPQETSADGSFQFFLPAGTYYFRVEAPGYRKVVSNIFRIDAVTPVNPTFELTPAKWFNFGWEKQEVKLKLPAITGGETPLGLNPESEAPLFSLPSTAGAFALTSLRGKPSVLSFLSSWSPASIEQLPILDELGSEVNSAAILVQDKSSKIFVFAQMGGYGLPLIVDEDGTVAAEYLVSNLPTHYFLDRRGVIKKIVTGVLGGEEIKDILISY